MLVAHDIDRIVVINNEKALVYLKSDRLEKYKKEMEGTFTKPAEAGPHFYFVIGSVETFERKLAEGFHPAGNDRVGAGVAVDRVEE